MGLFLPMCRTLHLPLLNLIRFLSAQLSSLSRSRWMAAQPSGVSTTPPSLVSSANLLMVHFNSSSRSLLKKLNKTGPSTDPWGTPLVTGLQLDSARLMTALWVLLFSQFSIHLKKKISSWLLTCFLAQLTHGHLTHPISYEVLSCLLQSYELYQTARLWELCTAIATSSYHLASGQSLLLEDYCKS